MYNLLCNVSALLKTETPRAPGCYELMIYLCAFLPYRYTLYSNPFIFVVIAYMASSFSPSCYKQDIPQETYLV